MTRLFILACGFLIGGIAFTPASAMDEGLDATGNQPLEAKHFTHWDGMMPVINDSHRVYYYRWGRGRSAFSFQGDTDDLNVALQNFSRIKSKRLDVVLKPAPGKTTTFHKKPVSLNWQLDLPNRWILKLDRPADPSHLVWNNRPVLTVYVGDEIRLDQIAFPKNVRVVQVAELQKRFAKALQPETPYHITGIAADNISALDRFDAKAMRRVVGMLSHEKLAVRNHAARAVARFGATAKPAIEQIRTAIEAHEFTEPVAKSLVEQIESAQADPEAKKTHDRALAEISATIDRLESAAPPSE